MDYIPAIRARATGNLDSWTTAYVTKGGTYILASSGRGNDDGRPHDLVAVLPYPIDGTHVVVLRPTANPEWVTALRTALDGRHRPPRRRLSRPRTRRPD